MAAVFRIKFSKLVVFYLPFIHKYIYIHTVPIRKKSKGAYCEGKSIPGLAKIRKWKHTDRNEHISEAGDPQRSEAQDEDYVLGKLLKKSLLNGAMKHDTIVDACEFGLSATSHAR